MAIKGKTKGRSRRVVAAPPRPTVYVRKPPLLRRRWFLITVAVLAVGGILAGVLVSMSNSRSKRVKERTLAAVNAFATTVEGSFPPPPDSQALPPTGYSIYPTLAADLDGVANGSKDIDGEKKGESLAKSAKASGDAISAIKVVKLVPLEANVSEAPGTKGPGATRPVLLESQFLLEESFRLFERVGGLMSQAAATEGKARRDLIDQAKELSTSAQSLFRRGYQKIQTLRSYLGAVSVNPFPPGARRPSGPQEERMRVAVVANPVSGRGKGAKLIPQVAAVLSSRNVDHRILESADGPDAVRLARQAADQGADVVAALGGDGQVGAVANGILEADRRPALAVVPAGTGNDFARALGLDRKDPLGAARLLAEPEVRPIDAVRLETPQRTCFFVNIGSAGFDAEVNAYANGLRLVKGTASYVIGVLVMLGRFRPGQFRIGIDGNEQTVPGMLIAVGNAVSYGGGMKVTPEALLDDGLLDVCLLGAVPRWEFLRTFPKVFTGSHTTHPAVQMARGRRVEVSAEREMQVFADGDHVGTLPATFQVMEGALQVVVAPGTTGRFGGQAGSPGPADG